ncbi:MAG: pilin [Candidatus Doudnabacteria bacterium]
MKKKIFVLIFIFTLTAPLLAAAAPCSVNVNNNPPLTPKDLPICVNQIYIWSLGISALLAMLILVIGGYYYMTASGNAEQSGKGIQMIWSAVIGLGLLFAAYLLLHTINPDLVNFPVNSLNTINQPQPGPRQTPQ